MIVALLTRNTMPADGHSKPSLTVVEPIAAIGVDLIRVKQALESRLRSVSSATRSASTPVSPGGIAIVVLTAAAGLIATIAWWERADQTG